MEFKCVEPIAMKCQNVNGGLIKKIGIAGGSTNTIVSFPTLSIHLTSHFQLTVSEEQLLEKTVICAPSSTMWHLEEKPEDEYLSFSCAYMLNDGTWMFQ